MNDQDTRDPMARQRSQQLAGALLLAAAILLAAVLRYGIHNLFPSSWSAR